VRRPQECIGGERPERSEADEDGMGRPVGKDDQVGIEPPLGIELAVIQE
jgi:hypothetical protein